VEVKLVDFSCCRVAYSIDDHNAGKELSATPHLTISTNIGLAMGEAMGELFLRRPHQHLAGKLNRSKFLGD
jgi:hypothetical protein